MRNTTSLHIDVEISYREKSGMLGPNGTMVQKAARTSFEVPASMPQPADLAVRLQKDLEPWLADWMVKNG